MPAEGLVRGRDQEWRGHRAQVSTEERFRIVHLRNAALEAEFVANKSSGNSTTTNVVDVLIEQNRTTFHDNASTTIPKLRPETTVRSSTFV